LIDDHAHPFALEPGPLDLRELRLDLVDLPEAADRHERLRPTYVWHALLTTRLADRLGCKPDEVTEARGERAHADYRGYTRALFDDAGITGIVMDPAWPSIGGPELAGTYADLTGTRVHLLHRIDPQVDKLLDSGAGFDDVVAAVDRSLTVARAAGFVGFKTIIAYRTGLAIRPDVTEREARDSVGEPGPVKRRAKPLRDFLVRRVLRFCADTGLPIQFHTGFGDSDIRLGEADPLLLEEVLRTPEGTAAPVVLIHGAYPFHEQVAFLAAARPNVHVDFSLFNLFAPVLLRDRLLRLVELAPTGKVLAGTDGFAVPESFWFAATVTREAWDGAGRALRESGVDEAWLQTATSDVFEDNARRLYGL
jgi:predicted TIM-barrel fold metal-dependent hydrolase